MVETKTPRNLAGSEGRARRWKVVIISLTLLVPAAGAGLWWFFGGEAPAEVDLSTTASSVAVDSQDEATGTAGSGGAVVGVEGTWSVDTTVGDFSATEDTSATFVGFRVDEVLSGVGSNTAVGRTPDVSGGIEIDGTTLTSAEIVADLTGIVSDESRREDPIQDALNTGANPDAIFTLTESIEMGEGAAAGELVSVTALGVLTINGVTDTVEMKIEAQIVNEMILLTGSAEVVFADYDVTAPNAPVVLSVENHGIIEFQVWLSR